MANTYLVNASGNIEMPLIGPVKVAGSTSQVAKYLIKNKREVSIDPSVRVRIKNFKVTVLGEVPGIYTIPNEKVTLIEALGLAGDLTIFGKRTNVLLIREGDGKREFKRIDLTSRQFSTRSITTCIAMILSVWSLVREDGSADEIQNLPISSAVFPWLRSS